MEARQAANWHGWFETNLGYWVHWDFWSYIKREKAAYWHGTAEDLCLAHGIEFDR